MLYVLFMFQSINNITPFATPINMSGDVKHLASGVNLLCKMKKDVKNYEGLYSASSDGRIWSHPKLHGRAPWKGFYLSEFTDRFGYKKVVLRMNKKGQYMSVHRIVAETFIPNPDNKPIVNHINGIKTDNRVENLEWCTVKENIMHSFKMGLSCQRGGKNANSKLTEKDVIKLREMNDLGFSRKHLSLEFKISLPTVCSIIKLKTWNHV